MKGMWDRVMLPTHTQKKKHEEKRVYTYMQTFKQMAIKTFFSQNWAKFKM